MTEEEFKNHTRKGNTKRGAFPQDIFVPEGSKGCPICVKVKTIGEFAKNCRCKDGRAYYCKDCSYEKHQKPNGKRKAFQVKRWQENNRAAAKVIANRCKTKLSYRHKQERKRRDKISDYISGLYSLGIAEIVGCMGPMLLKHLEDKMKEGMSWNNYGLDGWHIDHIIPLAAFDSKQSNHHIWSWDYRNLQPLWAKDNSDKKDFLPNGISVRRYRKTNPVEFHELIGDELERLGIVSKTEYLGSIESKLENGVDTMNIT